MKKRKWSLENISPMQGRHFIPKAGETCDSVAGLETCYPRERNASSGTCLFSVPQNPPSHLCADDSPFCRQVWRLAGRPAAR